MKKVEFKDISIGEEFECYGDIPLNYGYPKVCKCVKMGRYNAMEIGGMSFGMNLSDVVLVSARR